MARLALAVAILIGVAACSMVPSTSPESPGQREREALVTTYLAALEADDAAAILALVTPGVDAEQDVADALAAYGGVALREVSVSWLDEFDGGYVVASVTGTDDDGNELTVVIPMGRERGHYYLALGEIADPGPVASPESPRPSS